MTVQRPYIGHKKCKFFHFPEAKFDFCLNLLFLLIEGNVIPPIPSAVSKAKELIHVIAISIFPLLAILSSVAFASGDTPPASVLGGFEASAEAFCLSPAFANVCARLTGVPSPLEPTDVSIATWGHVLGSPHHKCMTPANHHFVSDKLNHGDILRGCKQSRTTSSGSCPGSPGRPQLSFLPIPGSWSCLHLSSQVHVSNYIFY